jgi:hypothetical protein
VLVKEAGKRLVEVPAVWETVTEQVMVSEASQQWKRGRAWLGQAKDVRAAKGFDTEARASKTQRLNKTEAAALQDDVMCLVEVPARYETVSKRVLKTPATVREIEVPAEYAVLSKQLVDREASVQEHDIPATYQKISTRVIDVETLRAKGYKFDDAGDIVATPSGERVLRASAVKDGSAAKKTAGAASGSEGYVREIMIPAEYRTVSRQIVDQPATVRQLEVPATYKTVSSRILKTAASTQEVAIPAVYKNVTRQVVEREASTRETVVPAQYATVSRKVVDTAPSTREIALPAKTQTLAHQAVDQEASTREETVAAVYKTITRQVVDQAASTREVDVPAVYQSASHQVKVADASTEWRSILCEVNATPTKIREIQAALKTAGYNPGPADGVVRSSTMRAVNDYQAAKGLPVDSYMNLETVKALGVAPH